MRPNRTLLKAFKIISRVFLWLATGLALIVAAVAVAVYVPAVQRFAIEKATEIVARETGVRMTVGNFRVRFPLGVSVRDAVVAMPAGDTLAEIGEIRVRAALWPLLGGRVRIMDVAVGNARVSWRDTVSGATLGGRIDALVAGSASLDPHSKTVSLTRAVVEGGYGAVTMGSGAVAPPTDTLPFDWNIAVERFEVRDFAFALDMPDTETGANAEGFDYRHVRVAEAGVSVRDFEYGADNIAVRFEELRLVERSGLRVTDGGGDFAMGRAELKLKDFFLETEKSRIEGSVTMGVMAATATAPGMAPANAGNGLTLLGGRATAAAKVPGAGQTPVSVRIAAQISPAEAALFAPLSQEAERALEGRTVMLEGAAHGTLDELTLEGITARIPGRMSIAAGGVVRSPHLPERLSGNGSVEGEFENLDFVRSFVADTALRRRLRIPRGMTLRVEAGFSPAAIDLKRFTLRAGGGRIDARGGYSMSAKTYAAAIEVRDFSIADFLPDDSLGVVAGSLTAKGRGFEATTLYGEATLALDRLEFASHDLGPVKAEATASEGVIAGTIKSRSGLIVSDIAFDARVGRETRPEYTLAARIDSTAVRLDGQWHPVEVTTLEASVSEAGTKASIRSGDMEVDVASPLSVPLLIEKGSRAAGETMRQLAAGHFNADSLQSTLPPMTLVARAGRDNFLHYLTRLRGFDFHTLRADATTGGRGDADGRGVEAGGDPFHVDLVATGLYGGGVTIDTLDVHAIRNADRLDYSLRMADPGGGTVESGLVRVSGSVGGNSLTARVLQRKKNGSTGFDFELGMTLADGTVRVEMASDPTLGYEKWRVGAGGAGNWLEVDLDGKMRADLHLTHAARSKHVALTTSSLPGITDGALRLVAEGLDIGPMLDLFPTAPRVGGIFGSNLVLGIHSDGAGNIMAARGTLGVRDFSYEKRRVADLDADLDFSSDGTGRMLLDAKVALEKKIALAAKGVYAGGEVDFDVEIPAVPLAIAESLLPAGTARLEGNLDGKLHVAGPPSRPTLTGDVGFAGGKITAEMIGTSFAISPERITIADDRVTFKDFGLVAPNNRRLTLDGNVNITDRATPTADVALLTRNFRFVNSNHMGGSQIYGTASLDADITARGPLDALRIRGDVHLSDDTDIVYIMRNTSTLRDARQHIVQFTDLTDTLPGGELATPPPPLRPAGVDMLLGVGIEQGLKATLSLDEVNENRVELTGGGDLSLSMNRQGDVRLAGRYTLDGGTMYYKPPVIPQKVFAVSDGSYVEWKGAALAPEFHVTATQTTRVRIESDGEARDVAFDITAAVEGSLKKIDMTFDVSAPGDVAIQNQLLAMNPEGRMQQAFGLMIYNQYNGPGVTTRGTAFDARGQLADFISKEINQWARNNLRGVDFSMGIATHNDSSGSTTDYSYSVSKKLFSDRVKIAIGGKVSDGAGTTQDNLAAGLLEDVTLEYRLTRRDNMFLKLYRYNTRESILEGEVTETGGGFVIRKKVNRITDIFRRKRTRKHGEK